MGWEIIKGLAFAWLPCVLPIKCCLYYTPTPTPIQEAGKLWIEREIGSPLQQKPRTKGYFAVKM